MSVAQFRVENGLIPGEHNNADLGHSTAQWKDVHVAGGLKLGTKTLDSSFALTSTDLSVNQITLGSLTIDSSTTFGLDSAGIVNIINANPTLDSALVVSIINNETLDSAGIVSIINNETLDSTHVKSLIAEEGLDSAVVNQIISQATSITDSSLVAQLIDSAYVQGKVPASYLTTTLDNDGYIHANQPLIQSFITGFSSPIVTIDSAFIQARAGAGTDSAAVIALIDSDYVQARQTASTDSAAVIALIDSAYVQARTTAGTDSAAVLAMIDSSHVQGKIPASFLTTTLDNDGYLYANQPLIQSFITGFSSPIVTIDSAFIQARAGGGGDSAINASNALLATNATKLNTARNIAISGFATGNANFDGSGDINISTTGALSGSLAGNLTITNYALLSNATSNWTGDPGAQGKIQYHSNRWYIVADQSSNRIVQFRRNNSDVSYVDNSGIYQGRATSANWADLAEKYEADMEYEEGTVVAIGGDKEITKYKDGMPLAGVISFHPGVRMNVTEENIEDPLFPFVALKGRVPVKIKGSATKGDYIVADDDGFGVACKIENCPHSNKLIGVAIETGSDMIEVKI
tara:strand:+ start:3686 stop:5419 length:1734 start_codon:yes stop_codon:yes gene_type:complete